MGGPKILLPGDFHSMPWKNGGGTTHEIARVDHDGKMLWRLSIAEVGADGPFSFFPGMTRLLAVIDGHGMRLEADSSIIKAEPLRPVRFSGDLAIFGRLNEGPVRDLNFIFDRDRIDGDMRVLAGAQAQTVEAAPLTAILCLAGKVTCNAIELPAGAVSFGEAQAVRLAKDAVAVLITGRAITV